MIAIHAILSAAIGALLAAALLLALATASPEPLGATVAVEAREYVPSGDVRERWAHDLAARIGNPQPSTATVAFLVAWSVAEDASVDGAMARFNPINTTQPAPGSWSINSVNVRGYPNYETGMRATIETITNGFYPNTLRGIQTNAPVVDYAELGMWGTGGSAVDTLWRR